MPGMAPNEIRAELVRRGITLAEIARDCGVTRAAASMVVQRVYRGERLRRAITRRLGLSYKEVWGEDPLREATTG